MRQMICFILIASLWVFHSVASAKPSSKAPHGWVLKGSSSSSYKSGLDHLKKHSGKASGFIQALSHWKKGFGTLMQTILADNYRGKRLRLTAWIQAEKVQWWSGLWMRVDGKKRKMYAFDNMQDRPIRGTVPWKKYSIVLDVPTKAVKIAFGLLLAGKGQVWLDDLKLEVVSKKIPTTDRLQKTLLKAPKNPVNTGFEK